MDIVPKKYRLFDIILISFRCAPLSAFSLFIIIILSGIVPTIQIIAVARFIDTAVAVADNSRILSDIYSPLLLVAGMVAFQGISWQLRALSRIRLETSIAQIFRAAITDKRAKLAYHYIENHDSWDLISRIAKDPQVRIADAFSNIFSFAALILRVAGVFALLFSEVWWAAAIIIAVSVPLFILALKSGKATYDGERKSMKYTRRYEYLTDILTGRDAVAERALFAFTDGVNQKWFEQYETARKITLKINRLWFIRMKSGSIIMSLISVIVAGVLIGPVFSGLISIGLYISIINAVFGLVQAMSWELSFYVGGLAKTSEYLKDLTQFSNLTETTLATQLPVYPPPVFESLVFEDVHFSYPGSDVKILNGLSFEIRSGLHYAFVGFNGAGKTTITKLITGLFDNFTGNILLNGKSIREYSQDQLKAFFSAVYQDFAKYSISLFDNVLLGSPNLPDSGKESAFNDAAHQVGLHDTIAELPEGYNTPLGKIKSNGQDLSGGQWQRVAMARAVTNPAPFRILDEPTSALDPISESTLYQEYEKMSENKTTLFISHRLGSTKLADEIFIIDCGVVTEKGSHDFLMSLGGTYATMYEAQRGWYL